MKLLTAIILITLCLTQISAQELSVPMGAEQMYSRAQSGLKGRVRTVLSVEKRDEGGFARTFDTVARSFDIQGAAIESLYHNADIEIHSRKLVRLDYSSIYSYDSKGRLAQVISYDPDGAVRAKDVFSYDDKGRLSGEINYTGESKLLGKAVFTHDPEKRTTTMTRTTYIEGREIPPSKSVFFYNDKGWWIKRVVYDSGGVVRDNTTFEHDNNGNLIKETKYDEGGRYLYAHLFSYKFDQFGNWVEKQTTYSQLGADGKATSSPNMVVYRVITYHVDK